MQVAQTCSFLQRLATIFLRLAMQAVSLQVAQVGNLQPTSEKQASQQLSEKSHNNFVSSIPVYLYINLKLNNISIPLYTYLYLTSQFWVNDQKHIWSITFLRVSYLNHVSSVFFCFISKLLPIIYNNTLYTTIKIVLVTLEIKDIGETRETFLSLWINKQNNWTVIKVCIHIYIMTFFLHEASLFFLFFIFAWSLWLFFSIQFLHGAHDSCILLKI